MMRRLLRLGRSERGSSIVEFALIAPAFIAMVIAIANFGILFFAQSSLKSAVAEGARLASIHPKPTNAQIIDRITAKRFGMKTANIVAPTVTTCVVDGRPCLDIRMGYRVDLSFVFFKGFSWSTYNLVENRRVYTYG